MSLERQPYLLMCLLSVCSRGARRHTPVKTGCTLSVAKGECGSSGSRGHNEHQDETHILKRFDCSLSSTAPFGAVLAGFFPRCRPVEVVSTSADAVRLCAQHNCSRDDHWRGMVFVSVSVRARGLRSHGPLLALCIVRVGSEETLWLQGKKSRPIKKARDCRLTRVGTVRRGIMNTRLPPPRLISNCVYTALSNDLGIRCLRVGVQRLPLGSTGEHELQVAFCTQARIRMSNHASSCISSLTPLPLRIFRGRGLSTQLPTSHMDTTCGNGVIVGGVRGSEPRGGQ